MKSQRIKKPNLFFALAVPGLLIAAVYAGLTPEAQAAVTIYASPAGGGDGSSSSRPTTLFAALTSANAISTAANPVTISLLDGLTYTLGLTDLGPGVSLASFSQDQSKVKITASCAATIASPWIEMKSSQPGSNGNQSLRHISFSPGSHLIGMCLYVQNRNNVTIDHCSFSGMGAMNDVEYHYAFETQSTQISKTETQWYNLWPANPTEANVNVAWPINPVENFAFTNNTVMGCYPLGLFHTKNAKVLNNYFDNQATHGWCIKSTCSVADGLEVGYNTFLGKLITTNTNWRVELWVHRNCRFHHNRMNGFYSITYGIGVEIDNNQIDSNFPHADYETGIETNGLSHSSVHHNWIKDAGCGIRLGMFNAVNGPDWICEDVTVHNNVVVNSKNPQIRLEAVGAGISQNHVTVRNFRFYNNTLDATEATRGLCGISLKQENQAGTSSLDNVIIRNNIVSNQDYTGGYGLVLTGVATHVLASHNLFYGNNHNSASGLTSTETLIADPLFVSPGTGFDGYALKTSPSVSPAINSGINVGLPFSSTAPDRGAIEDNGTTPSPPVAPRGLTIQ